MRIVALVSDSTGIEFVATSPRTVMSELLDRAGRRRSPAAMPGFHAGRPPRNTGLRYPADPPKVEEIVSVMRAAGDDAHGRRLRGLIVILSRAGLRIQEGLALAEADLDHGRGALTAPSAAAATLLLAHGGMAAPTPCAVGGQIDLPSMMTSTRPGQGASIPAIGNASSSDGDS